MTYSETIQQVVADGGRLVIATDGEAALYKPIVQYRETIWAFVLRMAGRLGHIGCGQSPRAPTATVLWSAGRKALSSQQVAVPYRGHTARAQRHTASFPSEKSGHFRYMELVDNEIYDLGDCLTADQMSGHVVVRKTALENGEVNHYYRLGSRADYAAASLCAPKHCGISLAGKVIAAEPGYLKLHLNIDIEQELDTAYWFRYRPHQGYVMYCMPLVGTRALLHLQDGKHQEYLVEHGKRMALLPKMLYFDTAPKHVNLDDSQGIVAETQRKLHLRAGGTLSINAGDGHVCNT